MSRPFTSLDAPGLSRAVRLVIIANFGYFLVEFIVATRLGSVALFADSIDFLEDGALNLLLLLALRWSSTNRGRLGYGFALLLLVPSLATLWTAWHKFLMPVPPAAIALSLTGIGAMAVNIFSAMKLARYRYLGGSLTRAAFLSARNDVLAGLAITLAGPVTFLTRSAWPDLVIGLAIAILNGGAALEVARAAQSELKSDK